MVSKTSEQALEATIEKALTGASIEESKGDEGGDENAWLSRASYGSEPGHGYVRGWSRHFNREFAVDTEKFWGFLQNTQPEELDKLKGRPDYQRLILERLGRKIRKEGIVKILKSGLRIDDARFELMYSPPYNDINPEVAKLFEKNIFSVTRQVNYSEIQPALSIDMVLFVNGMAVATLELKNPWTGQTAWHARKQYRENRDPREPLLQFGRCLVHFAMDTDDVYMTTRLEGEKTFFLPFNKGYRFGRGNPPNPLGHKTAYLWEEVLTRHSLGNIIEHFARRDRRTLFFPRYHQLEVVRKLLAHAREHGPGRTYLIQHSAGSGKTHSITWTAYQLIELYRKGESHPLFDSVVVVTDRRVLDRQLRDNIKRFSVVKNIVAPAFSSRDLKRALESGKKIIVTTIQKFPYIVEGIDDLSHKRFAVIIDEAHSSQSGTAADNLNRTLGADEDEVQDAILEAMRRRKMRGNASYLAFTATPKNATLEKFGRKRRDGKFEPFHLYSMKQAIEEGFILDVLANYTTYKSYYEIQKSIRENPHFDSARAQKKLRAHVEGHKETIAVKAEIMVRHFTERVAAPKKLKGKARGMVVTRNITTAVRYYFAVRDALRRANAPFKALVAFSGRKTVDGVEYDEAALNGFPSRDIEKNFDTDDYRLLVVANKFLTGFDQPALTAMYVDKRLQGVLAVQALSRLNRCNPALGKRTEDVFVLDFFNGLDDIQEAFEPFYTSTTLSRATDVNVLHDLKDHLDEKGVYERDEVEQFNALYFADAEADRLSPIVDLCAARFNTELELEEDDKADFKIKAKQFVKIYAQIACITPFDNPDWEMLYWFLKFLIPKLHVKDRDRDALDTLLESVDLSTYGLERIRLKKPIQLEESESEIDPQNPNPRGVHDIDDPRDPLDEIVRAFNERWFDGWSSTPEEQRIKFINIARRVAGATGYQARVVDNRDEQNRRIAMGKLIGAAVNHERRRELDLYKRYATDQDFKRAFDASITRILEQHPEAVLEGSGSNPGRP